MAIVGGHDDSIGMRGAGIGGADGNECWPTGFGAIFGLFNTAISDSIYLTKAFALAKLSQWHVLPVQILRLEFRDIEIANGGFNITVARSTADKTAERAPLHVDNVLQWIEPPRRIDLRTSIGIVQQHKTRSPACFIALD